MAGTPNQQLQALFDNFATQIGNGSKTVGEQSSYYQSIYNTIVGSSDLLAQYDAAAADANHPITSFLYDLANTGVAFNPSNYTIDFGAATGNMVSKATSPYTLINILGHEVYHAQDNAALQVLLNNNNNAAYTAIKNGQSDLTQFVAAAVQDHLNDEANANLQGWQDAVDAFAAANQVSQLTPSLLNQLIASDSQSFTLWVKGNPTPKNISGVTQSGGGIIAATPQNVAAAATYVGLAPPSNAPSIDYNQYYAANTIGYLCQSEAYLGKTAGFSINYSSLHLNAAPLGTTATLTTEQVDTALVAGGAAQGTNGMVLGSTGRCTITNSATGGGVTVFSQGTFVPEWFTALLPTPSSEPNATLLAPPPINGTLPSGWETLQDTENPNPNGTHSDVFGTAAILNENDNYDPITVLPGASGTIVGNIDVIDVDAGATANIQGNGNYAYAANGISVSMTGNGCGFTLGTSDILTLGANSQIWVLSNYSTANGAAGDTITVNGSYNTLTEGASSTWTVDGSFDTLTISSSSSTVTFDGGGEVVTATSDTVNFGTGDGGTVTGNTDTMTLGTSASVTLNGTGDTVSGSSDFLTLSNNATATVTGTGDTVTLGSTNTLTLGASSAATVNTNRNTINNGGSDTVTINGSSNTLTEGAGNAETINGSNNQLTINGASSTATLNGGGETVRGTSDTVNFGTGDGGTVTGNSDTMTLGASASVTLNGTSDTVSGSTDYLTLSNNATATVTGTGDTLTLGSSNTLTLNGTTDHVIASSDTIKLAAHSKSTIAGPLNAVTLLSSDQIFVNGGSDTINVQSGDIVDLETNDTVTIVGSGATIVGNTGDTISLTGTNDNIYGDSSAVTVNGTDTGDVVHGSGDTGNRNNWGGYVAASGAYGGYAGGGYYSQSGNVSRQGKPIAPLADIAAIGIADPTRHPIDRPVDSRRHTWTTDLWDVDHDITKMDLETEDKPYKRMIPDPTVSTYSMAQQLVNAMATWPQEPIPSMMSTSAEAEARGSTLLLADAAINLRPVMHKSDLGILRA